MAKIPVKIDEDIMEFIKTDAKQNYRSVAGQVNAVLDLCRQAGGYMELLRLMQRAEIVTEQTATRTETRGRKRTRPQKIDWSGLRGGCECAVILYNIDDDKALIVKTDDFFNDTNWIVEQLRLGRFSRSDIQADYSEKCCKFAVLSGHGETIEEVRRNCVASEFYDGIYDCTTSAKVSKDSQPQATELPETDHSIPTVTDVLSIDWDTMHHQQTLRKYLTICKNPEVREIAEAYIDEQFAPEDEIEPETVFAEDAAVIMDRFCRKYRK